MARHSLSALWCDEYGIRCLREVLTADRAGSLAVTPRAGGKQPETEDTCLPEG
jgi:hypothetical protein